jgi:hypothetical protein
VANAANLYPLGSNVGSIVVKDDAGGTRTSNAVYMLVSFGADGHGAWSGNGGTARRNVHAVNSNELQNCHCDTNGNPTAFDSTFVQMKESGDVSQNFSNFFDHTVRFAQLFDFTGQGNVSGTGGSSSSSAGGASSAGGSSSSGSAASSSGGSCNPPVCSVPSDCNASAIAPARRLDTHWMAACLAHAVVPAASALPRGDQLPAAAAVPPLRAAAAARHVARTLTALGHALASAGRVRW